MGRTTEPPATGNRSHHVGPDKLEEVPLPLPWYERCHYAQLREVMQDGAHFPQEHSVWEADAQRAESFFNARGRPTYRVYLDPTGFTNWCQTHGQATDSRGRAAFARWFAETESTGRRVG